MFENNGYNHNENERQNFDLNRMNYYQPYSTPSGEQRPPERKKHRKGRNMALVLARLPWWSPVRRALAADMRPSN